MLAAIVEMAACTEAELLALRDRFVDSDAAFGVAGVKVRLDPAFFKRLFVFIMIKFVSVFFCKENYIVSNC